MSLLSDSAVQAIQDSAKTQVLVVDGTEYASRPVFDPPQASEPKPLIVPTLSGLVNWLDAEGREMNGLMLVVESPTLVSIVDHVEGRHNRRFCYAQADCAPIVKPGFRYGTWMSQEDFVIGVMTWFEPTDTRAVLIKVAGNVVDENARTSADDGVTQNVTVKTGVTRVDKTDLPNPIALTPYRTFAEVSQPEGNFIFRMRRMDREGVQFALFESGDSRWRLDVHRGISEFLTAQMGGHEDLTPLPVIA